MSVEENWPALRELTEFQPAEQRRILRLHQESAFDGERDRADIDFRARLDRELQIITMRELRAQTDTGRIQQNYADIPEFKSLLSNSPAFAQYLNYYYYFGARFAAGRISNPCLEDLETGCIDAQTDCNEPILGLPSPPLCPEVWDGTLDSMRFIAETAAIEMLDPQVVRALRFLDDFLRYSDEPGADGPGGRPEKIRSGDERRDFELWLRDLYVGGGENRGAAESQFSGLATGLLKWAENRYRFYVSLEESGAKTSWIGEWKTSEWVEGRFQVNNPLAARCALVDFYWLARILRADVTPRGIVSYTGRSWLWLIATKRRPMVENVRDLWNLLGSTTAAIRPHDSAALRILVDEAATQDPVDKATAARIANLLLGRQPTDSEQQHWAKLLRLMTSSARPEIRDAIIDSLTGATNRISAGDNHPSWSMPAGREILRIEEVLRGVFSYACDLIQNAVQVAENCEEQRRNPADHPPRLPTTMSWRTVYDEELREITDQRREWRNPSGNQNVEDRGAKCEARPEYEGWSRRIWTGEDVHNLVGVALSGGGIRSATFNLGVLQQLQELDLLRYVDYLSTVSGGGYIGAWLIGNVRRTRYWLSRLTSWDKSIEHLRSYSNYLAPENGILRADSWTMWGTWLRNAFLIQLTVFAWLVFFLMGVLGLKPLFDWPSSDWPMPHVGQSYFRDALNALLAIIAVVVAFYLWQLSKPYRPPKAGSLERFRVWALEKGDIFARVTAGLAWIASFAGSAVLWRQAGNHLVPNAGNHFIQYDGYAHILQRAGSDWEPALIVVFVMALWLLALSSFRGQSAGGWLSRVFWPLVVALATSGTSYLTICGLLRFFVFIRQLSGNWAWLSPGWVAFVVGPFATLAAIALAVAVFIGLIGRDAAEWNREWWTRYGSWIAMYGIAALALTLIAVFAPLGIVKLFTLGTSKLGKSIKIGTIATWLGSIISGLFAGRSSKTGKDGKTSKVLEWLARVGGFLFIVATVAGTATLVYLVLSNILDSGPDFDHYFAVLSRVVVSPVENYEFWVIWVLVFLISLIFSDRFDLNTFGLNQFYRNRLVRCYLGATRWQPGKRHPHRFTAFDMDDDIQLACLTVQNKQFCGESFRGPLPLVNCTMNLGGSSDLAVHTRQSASFTLSPLFCGSNRPKVGYVRTPLYAGQVTLGQAISISGAAASPNMGYTTSPLVSFLLTMFNVRLGWWFANPGTSASQTKRSLSAFYLLRELFGTADERKPFVNVSDGGHFENLGIYELIRRRARVIIAGDAECDPDMNFGSLGKLIRICDTDFGAHIEMDVGSLRKPEGKTNTHAHCAVGKIVYSNGSIGYLIYLKSSLTGDEDVGISQYRAEHETFPHETTADQFFSEDQFEAYRRLGSHITERTFRGASNERRELFGIASKLFDIWVPSPFELGVFLDSARDFDRIWDRFRQDPNLTMLFAELTGQSAPSVPPPPPGAAEFAACMELLQLMENVFLGLRMDDFWDHPDNRGWAMLFTMWAQSQKFRAVWEKVRHTYGIRFEYFCERYLGLQRDIPVLKM